MKVNHLIVFKLNYYFKCFYSVFKETDTQLQFKFEFVGRSEQFPMGVKTSYRAFCCDEVIELNEVFSNNPLDSGFQPVMTEVKWQPDHNNELLEVLVDIPNLDFISSGFVNGSRVKLNNTIRDIEHYFTKRLDIIKEWHSFDSIMPKSDFATPYAVDYGLHIPLKDILFGVQIGFDSSIDVAPIVCKSRKTQYDDKDIPKQKSTASIKHSGNKGLKVPAPRFSLESKSDLKLTDEERLQIISKKVQELTVRDLLAEQLKQLCSDANIKLTGLSNKTKLLEA